MNYIKPIALISLAALAACNSADITQAPIQYRATQALNAYGTSDFTARTYTKTEGGSRKEVSGVPCKFVAPGFNSSFTTPAVVVSPNMGPRTPAASVTCTYNGAEKVAILRSYNETTAEISSRAQASTAGMGLLGAVVGGIVATSQINKRDVSRDIFGYPDTAVVFDVEK